MKTDMRGEVTYLLLLLCSVLARRLFHQALNTTTAKDKLLHLSFHCCLSVVLWPEEGDFPENVHCVVYFIINKHSFESFMCFGSYLRTLAVILVSDLLIFLSKKFLLRQLMRY